MLGKHNKYAYLFFIFGLILLLNSSCSSTRKIRQQNIQQVIDTAKSYQGTPYRYGGNTRSGMDCSALVYLSFQSVGVNLPRVSAEQSKIGKKISRSKLKKGDVIFFATGRRRNKVTHAGIVLEKRMGKTYFIHASTSLGVTEDNLQSTYWSKRWVRARRIF
ncbi:C40 family peptidase [Cyclobacterium marinum]|uniref:NLP/P60 protein n=1 Tax=Cyclobacterium marinum (strain ATCC 25205 / DSM 745 / LMG 13164 / NCIMB 1802) TaxID=880070 RepID=G0J169_CYCMS|nr:C40 family peptidase [Cyclobacterium marinum]AEL25818.1 NLP/P60 protein [Cyclobacterium marinum DSM 745]MBI0401247.1 C40 family peptidase [Cyclobacterium marinum]MBR9776336.1 C40 family peptidase [Cytophagales bacterium]|tara:strand:+ start:62236 stop:62718 length:483 start_codon:yes stop_codon:yes gene_type:complete